MVCNLEIRTRICCTIAEQLFVNIMSYFIGHYDTSIKKSVNAFATIANNIGRILKLQSVFLLASLIKTVRTLPVKNIQFTIL